MSISLKEKTPIGVYYKLVTSTEFESVNAAVKGQCVKPLHQQGKSNEQYNTIINKKEKQEFISLFF